MEIKINIVYFEYYIILKRNYLIIIYHLMILCFKYYNIWKIININKKI